MGALSQSGEVGDGWGLWPGTVRGAQGPQRLGGEVVSTKLDLSKPLKSADSLRTHIPASMCVCITVSSGNHGMYTAL